MICGQDGKRVVVLTDSLGMPRNESPIEETWTERFCEHIKREAIVKCLWQRGLSLGDIVRHREDYITLLKPDVLLIQAGIVDCPRRAQSARGLFCCKIMGKLPLFRHAAGAINRYCSKNHYALTKRREIRYAAPDAFEGHVRNIVAAARAEKPCRVAMIAIAPPAFDMVEKIYQVRADVARYNAILQALAEEMAFDLLDPYAGLAPETLVLADGHHLSAEGNRAVAQSVLSYWQSLTAQNQPGGEKPHDQLAT